MDTSKIIKGVVGGTRYTETSAVIKEDHGLYLKIEGVNLPPTYEVDFSNDEHHGTSVTMIGNSDGVLIPSQFISSGKDVFAFLYHVGADFGRTVYKFRIPNKVRPDRTNAQPTPEEQSVIDQAISALNSAVTQTAQDVISADASAQSASTDADRAEQAKNDAVTMAQRSANSAQASSDSADSASASATASAQSASQAQASAQTAQDALEEFTTPTASATTLPEGSNATASYADGHFTFGIPTGATGAKGDKGDKGDTGADGYSPTVTITPITGGHRITITDADGEHSADVMDGTGNVDDVQINGQSIVSDGVANVPVASASEFGAVKTNGIDLIVDGNGNLLINSASATEIKTRTGTSWRKAIINNQSHTATFYGLAKAASDTTQSQSSNAVGNYTESAKSAISEMLNGSVSVSGTTPTIVAKSGIRYVCGEVATLDLTPPASGICDVVFESGATATVLTITGTVKWANGFDPTSLDTNTTYEINIMDGLGVAVGWT